MNEDNNVFEKVYLVEDFCSLSILEGVAKYENEIYYFDCIYSEVNNCWTEEYNLKLLNKYILNLIFLNDEYWKLWKNQSEIPHLVDYKIERKVNSFEEMLKWYENNELLIKAEQNYENNKIINEFLESIKPKYKLKGIFYVDDYKYNVKEIIYDDINEYNIKVKWIK